MPDVKLMVAGRSYDVHCAEGQEAQLHQLAAVVDAKARGIQGGTEGRQLLFAALMLADEVGEAQSKQTDGAPQLDAARAAAALAESRMVEVQEQLRGAVEREKTALQQLAAAQQTTPNGTPSRQPAHDRALLQIADRIEALADRVEQAS